MFGLFGAPQKKSAILIDISSSSIGGACVVYPSEGPPIVPYAVREEISFQHESRSDVHMLRTLETVLNRIHEEGIVALHRAEKIHTVDRIFISIDAPWQETRIESKIIGDGKSFVFTREMLSAVVAKRTPLPEGDKELQSQVVATLLNGYQTTEPYGKRVERAEIILLSSSMNGDTMALISRAAKRFGARQGVHLAPVQSVAHAVLRAQYPHDRDFLLMLVSDEATNVLFAKQGILMDARSVPIGLSNLGKRDSLRTLPINGAPAEAPAQSSESLPSNEGEWALGITGVLKEFATRHALPRIVFLVANDGSAGSLKRFLDTADMHALWLSDESLTIIPVISKLLSSLIKHQGQADADVMLDLNALYARLRLSRP
jgi:hypothetical protein